MQVEKPAAADIRHMLLFGYHPDTTRLLVFGALAAFDVTCPVLCGYRASTALHSSFTVRCSNAPSPAGTPLGCTSLAAAFGMDALLQQQAASVQRPPCSFAVPSYEALAAGGAPVPWFACSQARHAFMTTLLLQLLASQGIFAGEPALVRALFAVQATPLLHHNQSEARLEAQDAAAERARLSAKRWLQEPLFSGNLVAWSAFAANEAHAGRHKQASKVCIKQWRLCLQQPASRLQFRWCSRHVPEECKHALQRF